MRTRLLALSLVLAIAGCSQDSPTVLAPGGAIPARAVGDREIVVTSGADSGPGTLRAALEEASADPTVVAITVDLDEWTYEIEVWAPLTFTGPQPLTLDGNHVSVRTPYGASWDVFTMNIRNTLTFNRFLVGSSGDAGLKVNVAPDATGIVRVNVMSTLFTGHRRHAILVNDLPAYLDDPATMSTAGSPASLRVEIYGSHFGENGQAFDENSMPAPALPEAAAIRVNEGGDGHATVILNRLQLAGNKGHGVLVDERGKGTLDFRFDSSTVQWHGGEPYQFDGSRDGVFLIEGDAGDLKSYVHDVVSVGSSRHAFNYRENGAGNVLATFLLANVSFQTHDAIAVVEDDLVGGGGNLTLEMTDSQMENGYDYFDQGIPGIGNILAHEKGSGSADVRLTRTRVTGGYGGLSVREDDGGNLVAALNSVLIMGNATFGAFFDERGRDNLVATVTGGDITDNGVVGIRAAAALPGTGSLTLTGANVSWNAGGTNNLQVVPGQVTVVTNP